jgi:hypothetical protein
MMMMLRRRRRRRTICSGICSMKWSWWLLRYWGAGAGLAGAGSAVQDERGRVLVKTSLVSRAQAVLSKQSLGLGPRKRQQKKRQQ